MEHKAEQNSQVISKSRNLSNTSPYKAFFCALISGLSFSVIGVLGKITEVSKAAENSIYFSVGVLVFTLPISIFEKRKFNMEKIMLFYICLRGIFSALTTFTMFVACRLLPLGDASVIIFSSPVFVTILARIFFKEKCTRVDVLNLILTLTGFILVMKIPQSISQPEKRFSIDYLFGLLAAFGTLCGFTGSVLFTRRVKSIHYSIVTILSTSVSLIICCIINAFIGKFGNPCGKQYFPLALGFLAFIGRIGFVRAIQLHNAGPVSTLRSCSDIAFAFFWQVTYFGEIPDAYGLSGAILVISSILFIGLKAWIFTLPEESVVKKKTRFLMK